MGVGQILYPVQEGFSLLQALKHKFFWNYKMYNLFVGDWALSISPVQLEDEAEYQCQVHDPPSPLVHHHLCSTYFPLFSPSPRLEAPTARPPFAPARFPSVWWRRRSLRGSCRWFGDILRLRCNLCLSGYSDLVSYHQSHQSYTRFITTSRAVLHWNLTGFMVKSRRKFFNAPFRDNIFHEVFSFFKSTFRSFMILSWVSDFFFWPSFWQFALWAHLFCINLFNSVAVWDSSYFGQ